jgi:putative nucleotidyltransferase with HDIG domain
MEERVQAAAGLGLKARSFLTVVTVAGLLTIAASLYQLYTQPPTHHWYFLAALTLLSGSATVRLLSIPATISISETFVFASVLLFGPAAGTLTVALDGLMISFWMAKRRPEWYRALFNVTAPALSIWCASQLLFRLADIDPFIGNQVPVTTLIVPLIILTVIYFVLNSSLITLAVSFETDQPAYAIWKDNFSWISLNYFFGASVALLIVPYVVNIDIRLVAIIVPLLLVLHITFKTSTDRIADAHRHIAQVNTLYLSTIETLAMAIDAKDQITHGHIRRVQNLAVGLAKRMHVADPALIRAIEAAALLHDMGKLAIPEYILNKPGRLTPHEFETMKMHVTVGADILAAIEFPYPVVPIVRCHHENWDGTGYPSGLRGTDIPIGARILSVVDCFDALTSDRPYRAKLTDHEALEILIARRGTMYDPLVVDIFQRVYREIGTEPGQVADTRQVLDAISFSTSRCNIEPRHITPNMHEQDEGNLSSLFDEANLLAGHGTVVDTCGSIGRHLSGVMHYSLCGFYIHNEQDRLLELRCAVSDSVLLPVDVRIPIGRGLSGWVAAHRETIVNSDAVLDLGEIARAATPPLVSSLSTPLILNGHLVGVVTLYSDREQAFREQDRTLLQALSERIAQSIVRACTWEQALGATAQGQNPIRHEFSSRHVVSN